MTRRPPPQPWPPTSTRWSAWTPTACCAAFASMIQATLRTNYFVSRPDSARAQNVLSFKLNPGLIDELPLPRPKFEIFVYSPRVEGVHLRFGFVARGGLRWSDRREDFRTEILGLVKAQAVKNAVIVPGRRQGRIRRQEPAGGHRRRRRRPRRAAHRGRGLLQAVHLGTARPHRQRRQGHRRRRHPARCGAPRRRRRLPRGGRRQGHRDVLRHRQRGRRSPTASGSATRSRPAVRSATTTRRWASPPRARGRAVKRHFREMGVDTQSEDFTVVGVGDMSGDVFGNGMLLSKHIRLVAAFDHRHIFLDPNPDAATSWEERKRLFDLPRSSWEDYDKSLISEGGGVYSREQKSIPISPQARAALGIEDGVEEMTPPALMQGDPEGAGGPAVQRRHRHLHQGRDRVGRRRRRPRQRPVRVNGNQVRAKVIGEGGNLGVTSLGRIEFDLAGGRINTDALDNSAGVDCSDHEVNIKILIDSLVTAGKVRAEDRTDAAAVDDRRGRPAGAGRQRGSERPDGHQPRQRGQPAARARPHDQGLRQGPRAQPRTRGAAVGEGDPAPHRSRNRSDLTGTRDADGPRQAGAQGRACSPATCPTRRCSPPGCRGTSRPSCATSSAGDIRSHQLRREIVTTMLVNDLVDTSGITLRLPGLRGRRRRAGRRGAQLRRHRCDLPDRRGVAADPRCRRRRSVGRRLRSDDAGSAPAHRPRGTLAAQLPAAAAGGRRRDQPVRGEGRAS